MAISLRELFDPTFRGKEGVAAHEKDFIKAKAFFSPVFEALNEDDHWESVFAHTPYRIEVALLPMDKKARVAFPDAPADAFTLFIALPRGCIKSHGKLQWGADVPSKFHFGETKEGIDYGVPLYRFLGSQRPLE